MDSLISSSLVIDGAGGKGTWGKLLDTDGESHIDRNDPNYDSGEVFAYSNSIIAFLCFLFFNNINYAGGCTPSFFPAVE